MLRYENPFGEIALPPGAVEQATRILAQSVLVTVAHESGLDLFADSFGTFTDKIDEVIQRPDVEVSPADLIRHAEAYALRGAQAMIAEGETRFHEWTWLSDRVCPLWPFC